MTNQDNSSANKRLAKNSLFLSIRMVLVLLISFYTTRVLLKILGVEDYGVYNVVCGFVSMFAFLNTSLSNGLQRFHNFELERNGIEAAKKVFNNGIIIQTILSVILVLIVEFVGIWYIDNKMVLPEGRLFAAHCIFQFSLLSLVITILQAPFVAAVMAHERLDFYAILTVIDSILKLVIVIVLPYLSGDSLIWYGLLWCLVSALNIFAYSIYSRINFDEVRLRISIDKPLLKSMLGFSGWNIFGTFSNIVREEGINLILNLFCGPVVNAARGVANQINGGVQSFVQNITTPARPQVIQSYARGDYNRTTNLTFTISKLSCFFITLLALPICYEIDTILKIWLGDNIPEHTAAFVILIIMCSYQGNLNAATSTIVHATGNMKNYQLYCSLIKLLSVPIGYFLLSKSFQPEIILLIVFFLDWASHFAGLFTLSKIFNISIRSYIREVIFPIIGTVLLSSLIIFPIHQYIDNDYWRLATVTIASCLVICIFTYFIGLKKNERFLLNQILKHVLVRFHIHKYI